MNDAKAVFLDLQGTLGGDGLGDVRDFTPYPFTAEAIRLLNESGLLAIVITNQSHIGKGLFTYSEYEQCMSTIKQNLSEDGAYLDEIYCCPHASSHGCDCKKPLPRLALEAADRFGIILSQSYVVGDMGSSDMRLAYTIGAKGVLVLTGVGKGSMSEYRHTWDEIEPAYVADDVLGAVRWIILQDGTHRLVS